MAGRLGLVIRSAPEAGRSLRDALDMALAAAALEQELCLVFVGQGVRQLMGKRDPAAAGLPAGLKGWASLDELTQVSWLAPHDELRRYADPADGWIRYPTGLSADALRSALAGCDQVWTV